MINTKKIERIQQNYKFFNNWSTNHLATLICILFLILILSFLTPLITKQYSQVHEFGHGLAALILAQSNLTTGENLTISWVFSGQNPILTRASWQGLTSLQAVIISMGGGIMEILITFFLWLLIVSIQLSSGKKVRDVASIMFLFSAIFFSLFYSVIFADTDGLALNHLMSEKFGIFWGYISSIVGFIAVGIAIICLGIAICIDVVEILERNKFIIKLNNFITTKLKVINKEKSEQNFEKLGEKKY